MRRLLPTLKFLKSLFISIEDEVERSRGRKGRRCGFFIVLLQQRCEVGAVGLQLVECAFTRNSTLDYKTLRQCIFPKPSMLLFT